MILIGGGGGGGFRHYSFTTFLKYNFCEHNFDFVLYALSFVLSFFHC